MTDPTDDGEEEPLVIRDVDWSQCHMQLTAYGFAEMAAELELALLARAIDRMHDAPSRPFVGAYLLELSRALYRARAR
jgi:hypothetical protein